MAHPSTMRLSSKTTSSCLVLVVFLLTMIQLSLRSVVLAMATTTAAGESSSLTSPRNVLVTGAGGKTGRLVLQKLLERPTLFAPVGVVRTAQSKAQVVQECGVPESQIRIADICNFQVMQQACQGMHAVIICTSATPAPTGEMTQDGRPKFGFPNGQPEQVDWLGQKHQIDAAQQSGTVAQVVICSSMGGTNPENPLNNLGRDASTGKGGNILLWKRKAEKYLIDSGLDYTIIHPGGLLDEPGGKRQLVVGVNDKQVETTNRSIPRADVAALLVAALEYKSYKNRSFDARSFPEGQGVVTTDLEKLLVDMKENCDYSLGTIPE